MNKLLFLLIFIIFVACSSSERVYWCGDHACINKKEKEAYFKKTMIVEVRDIKNKKFKGDTEYEKILKQAEINEKIRIKDEKILAKETKIELKKRIKQEKFLAKQAKLAEKKLIKEEKYLAKKAKKEEKKLIKKQKSLAKKTKTNKEKNINYDDNLSVENSYKTEIKLNKFSELVEKINKNNAFKEYPDINDIPE